LEVNRPVERKPGLKCDAKNYFPIFLEGFG